MTNVSTANTSTEDRAIELLAAGITQASVASALGVTEGRISQIIANPVFASRLAEQKYTELRKHNVTDNKYDRIENKALDQLEKTLPIIMDPMKLTMIVSRLNQAKRRGASSPDSLVRQNPTVRLNLGTRIIARFAVNGSNQVVQASIGEEVQDLVTIQSGNVQRLLNEHVKNATNATDALLPGSTGEVAGEVWSKPQGREKVDLLTELGFSHEVTISQD